MAITAAIRSDIIELSVLATNQATGTVKLGALVAEYEKSGMTGVGASLTGTAAWKAKYPSFQTPEEFGKEFLEAIVPGLSAAALAEGVTIVAGLLNSGSTQADVLIASSDFLSNASVTDATFGDYAAKFQNQAAVAEFHTITQELNTELVLTNITSDAATVVTAKGDLDGSTAAAAVAAAKVISDATAPADAEAAVTAGATANTAAAAAIAAIVDTATASAALVSANAADTAAAAATTLTATYTTIAAATADAADDTAAATLAATAATQATTATGYVTSATAEVAIDRTASTYSLTNALDLGANFVGGAGDDTFSAVETVSTGTPSADTFTTGDSIDGGAGIDTLTVAIAGAPVGNTTAGVATTNVERLSLYNNSTGLADYTLNAAQMSGLTDLYINGGNEDTLFTNVTGTPNLHLLSTSRDTTVTATAASVLGTADSVTIASNASALTANATATYNGIETVNLAIGGQTGTAAFNLTIASADLENIVVTGSSTANLAATFTGAVAGTQTATFDASAATGNIVAAVTRGASPASAVTMGAGDDRLDFLSAISEKDVLVGGAGTDTLEIGGTNDWGKTAITQDDLSGISGFETLRLKASGLVDARVLSGNTAITNVEFEGTGTYTDSAVTDAKSLASGTVTLDLATDGATDTLNYTSAGLGAITSTLAAFDMETVNVTTGGAGNTALTISAAAATAVNDLTTVVATGTQSLNLTAGGKSTASVNASGLTGLGEAFVLNAGTSTAALTVVPSGFTPTTALTDTVNTITTGTGADTLTGTAFIDILSGGTGNDTITGGGGRDQLNGGAGNDSITGGATIDQISDGAGNDVVLAGDGVDTITLGTGSDDIDGGAGNDVLNAGANLTTGDTIKGGAGTDALTATLSGVGQAPTVSAVESISIGFGASTYLDMTSITDVTAITVDSATAGGVSAQLKSVPTGTTITVTDEASLAGAGNLTSLTVDTVKDGTLGIKIGANKNAATAAATSLTGMTITDAASVAFTNVGGSASNVLDHQITGNIALDAADTTALSITTSAHGAFDMVANDFTGTSKVASLTVSAAAGGDITFDDMVDALALQSIAVTATGANSDINITDIGNTESLALQTINLTATAGGEIDIGFIKSETSNVDTITILADGTDSDVTQVGNITTTNMGISTTSFTASDRGNVVLAGSDLVVGSGLINNLSLSSTGRATMLANNFVANSTSTVAGGAWSFTSGTRGTLNLGNAAIDTNGSLASLTFTVGGDSTTAFGTAAIAAAGAVTSLVVTTAADAATSGALALGQASMNITAGTINLNADADNTGDVDLTAAVVTKLTMTFGGTADLQMNGTTAGDYAIGYDGNADAITTATTSITELVVNASANTGGASEVNLALAAKANYSGTSVADLVYGAAGADTISGGAGADILSGAAGTDTVSGGAGADVISGGAAADSLSGGTGADVFAYTSQGSLAMVETTNGATGVKEVGTLTITGSYVAGEVITITDSGGNAPTYTVLAGDSISDVAAGITASGIALGGFLYDPVATAGVIVFTETASGNANIAVLTSSVTTQILKEADSGVLVTGAVVTLFDKISDFAKAEDSIALPNVPTVAASGNTSTAGVSGTPGTTATSNVAVAAGGKVTFATADDTLAERIVAIAADDTDLADSEVAFFEHGGNTYVYAADDTSNATADGMIELTGVTGLTTLTVTAGVLTFA